jgi:hypothetical protein
MILAGRVIVALMSPICTYYCLQDHYHRHYDSDDDVDDDDDDDDDDDGYANCNNPSAIDVVDCCLLFVVCGWKSSADGL